jgi:hypothetical protein
MKVMEVIEDKFNKTMEVKMQTRRLRLTKAEIQEHHANLLWLKRIGIPVSSAGDLSHRPKAFNLYQVDHELARICDLPGAGFALALPAKLLVVTGGTLIMGHEMTVPWYPLPLELSDPEARAYYSDIIYGSIPYPPKILNPYLTGELPLRRGQIEGMIIGFGWNSVPLQYHDYTKVPIELCLWDERENEFWFNFEARVDGGLKVACERRERAHRRRGDKRQPIFQREEAATREPSRTTEDEGTDPISPSPVVVSEEKPMEGRPPDAPRDETDESIGL